MNLILASRSPPRRRELLAKFGLEFSVQVLPAVEIEVGEPIAAAETNAVAKALPVSEQNPGH